MDDFEEWLRTEIDFQDHLVAEQQRSISAGVRKSYTAAAAAQARLRTLKEVKMAYERSRG